MLSEVRSIGVNYSLCEVYIHLNKSVLFLMYWPFFDLIANGTTRFFLTRRQMTHGGVKRAVPFPHGTAKKSEFFFSEQTLIIMEAILAKGSLR